MRSGGRDVLSWDASNGCRSLVRDRRRCGVSRGSVDSRRLVILILVMLL